MKTLEMKTMMQRRDSELRTHSRLETRHRENKKNVKYLDGDTL